MGIENYKVANDLNGSAVDKIRNLEKELGACILALEPRNTVKQLCEEDVEKVQKLEKDLNVVLVVYRQEVCRMH